MAVLNPYRIRKSAVGLEEVGVALVTAKPQAGGDVQRHLVTAVRDAARRRPAMLGQDVQCPEVFNETVGQSTVELQPVTVRTHAAVTQQIAGVLVREEGFSRRHRTGIEVRAGGLE